MLGCDTCIWFWVEDLDDGGERVHCADGVIDRMRVECPDWQEEAWLLAPSGVRIGKVVKDEAE